MAKSALVVIVVIQAHVAQSGCGGSDGGDDGGDHSDEVIGDPTGATCPEGGTELTYEEFGKPFVETYCLRCHSDEVQGTARMGAPSDHNFDTHFECQALSQHMDELAGSGPDATNTDMPPDDPRPTVEERRMLSEWLACGGP